MFRDVQTGFGKDSIKNRPGVLSAIQRSRETGFPIIVDGLDRFARSTEALEKHVAEGNLKVISAKTGDGASRAVIMAEAERAQAEGERIRRTTRAALQRLREQGVQLGNLKTLAEAQRNGAAANKRGADKRAKNLAAEIGEIRAAGKTTKAEVAEELNRRGHCTPRGERWNQHTIRRVLQRVDEMKERAKEQVYENNPNCGIF